MQNFTITGFTCLSVRQPWAWLIVHAGKDIENRTWRTNIRGPILIHDAKGCTEDEYWDGMMWAWERDLYKLDISAPTWKQMKHGGIIGSVEIVDCVTVSQSKWFTGPYGFVLRNPQPLPFEPCRGALGFWKQNTEVSCDDTTER